MFGCVQIDGVSAVDHHQIHCIGQFHPSPFGPGLLVQMSDKNVQGFRSWPARSCYQCEKYMVELTEEKQKWAPGGHKCN